MPDHYAITVTQRPAGVDIWHLVLNRGAGSNGQTATGVVIRRAAAYADGQVELPIHQPTRFIVRIEFLVKGAQYHLDKAMRAV
jgi:hypothetical protein